MISIEKILVEEEVANSYFLCDLDQCKGACCTFPGVFGAPLLDEEIQFIEDSHKAASKYLSRKSLDYIEKFGFCQGAPGSRTTVCIDQRDCVYVFYEGDIAKCALEKAWVEGESKFRKPISCHLFPIRVGNFGGDYLRYEKIKECKPAIENGMKNNCKLASAVSSALERAYGKVWLDKFLSAVGLK